MQPLSPFALCRRPVHFDLAAAVEAAEPVAGATSWVGQGDENDWSVVEGADRLLVHEVLVCHQFQ